MVDGKPDISDLACELPHAVSSHACSCSADDRHWYQFATLVRDCSAKGDTRNLQSAFDRLEQFLTGEDALLRDWVTGFLQALQDVSSWSVGDGEPFLPFMGEHTRHIWSTLYTIRYDLADCSTLEAEVLMWRVVHPTRQDIARS